MTKLRVLILLSTVLTVGFIGYFVSLIARGYRFDLETYRFSANGILVIKSEPDGASIYVDGDLKGATNSNLKLAPGSYDVEIKKEGYLTWSKRLTIKKEEVSQITAQFFKVAPSLSPITFDGAVNPVVSDDFSKIAYINGDGLWVMSVSSLPIGFTNEPKKITDGITENATYTFSPNSRQILLKTSTGLFLLNANELTPQNIRINIANIVDETLEEWSLEKAKKEDAQLKNIPQDLVEIFTRNVKTFTFSPDENMVMYIASSSAQLKENLIPKLPGSSTQKENRDIKEGKTYIYDIKEDKNFLISENESPLYWLPNSRNLIESLEGKIVIMDYDGTNRQVVFSGNYIAPHAYPFVNASKLLILTDLGSDSPSPNLYSLTIK